jgi:DNA-binding transcriptional regulator LsrR (DeoR family)
MVVTREEKEKLLLDLYYNKGYTFRQITTELKMSPSKAYKLYSKGKNREQVAIMLNIPEAQATQFHFEYFRLTGQDELFRCMQGQKANYLHY